MVKKIAEEVAQRRPEPPFVEVCEADDVTGGGFDLSSLLGTIHSGHMASITGWRSPSSMSHDAIFSLKLEWPHGSIEVAERTLWWRRLRWQLQGEFSNLSLSLSLTLPCWGTRKAKGRGVRRRGKNH
jgi:hypothetical protein